MKTKTLGVLTRLGLALALVLGFTAGLATVASATITAATFGTTLTTSSITATTATVQLAVNNKNTSNSNPALSNANVCYSTTTIAAKCTGTPTPTSVTATLNPASIGHGASGTQSATLTGLTQNTKYYVMFNVSYDSAISGDVSYSAVYSFTTVRGPTVAINTATNVSATSAQLNATVNANSVSTAYTFCYSTSNTLASCGVTSGTVLTASGGTLATGAATAIDSVVTSLTPGATYYYQVKGVSTAGTQYSTVSTFTTTASGVLLVAGAATNVGSSSATLNGTVNPNGVTGSATVSFCYSASSSLANCSGALGVVALPSTYSGTTATPISTVITGLTSGKTYYYELEAVANSVTTYSPVLASFTTAGGPLASTPTTSLISGSGATFGGVVTANGASTTVSFCYSTSTLTNCTSSASVGYVAATQSPVASTISNSAVSATLANGLTPNTTYYYQVMAQNAIGSGYSAVGTFKTIGAPFVCNTNFYQVSATAPQLFTYSVSTNKFTTIGSNTKGGNNALAYDSANNYLYVFNGSTMYEIDSTGTYTSLGTVSGAETVGASFIGATNLDLTTNGGGAFSVVNVGASPIKATPFTVTTSSGSKSWSSADVAVVANSGGTYSGYGMDGTTLNILNFASSTATSGVETSRTVVSGTGGYSIPTGVYGASYADQSGDVFFFNNGDSEMWEITAAQLAGTGSATATLVTTSIPALDGPNDGASCDLAPNPFGPPTPVNDTYNLTLNGTNPVSVSSVGSGVTANDQSGTAFAINSVTFDGQTASSANITLDDPGVGSLDVTDFANGYFTFTPATSTPQVVTFTYSLVQTGVSGTPLVSTSSATVTVNLVNAQVVTWNPTTSLLANASPYTPPVATSTGNGAITYAVDPTQSNTSGCTVNATTGVLTYSGAGTCSVIASAAATSTSAAASTESTFTISLATPVITWNTNFSFLQTQSPYTPSTGAVSSSNGAITYAIDGSGNTAGCTNAGTATAPIIHSTGTGSCVVDVTTAATSQYTGLTTQFTFTVSTAAQTVTWTPVTAISANPTSPNFTPSSLATTNGTGAITYAVSNPGTSGCTVNPTTGVVTYTGVGNCTITATAAANSAYSSSSVTQTFDITGTSFGITWAPNTQVLTTDSPVTPTAATDGGVAAITYAVNSFTTATCSVNATTGVLTFTGSGTCTVTASTTATPFYPAATNTQVFYVSLAPQTVTWAPTTAITMSTPVVTPSTSATTIANGGAITYSVTSAGTTGCTVNATTGVITYTAAGSCQITATAAQTLTYAAGTNVQTFVFTQTTPTVTWAPTLAITANPSSPSFTPSVSATTSGNGAITYTVRNAGTTGCTVNATTGVVTYTGVGTCQIRATAAATFAYKTANSSSQSFVISTAPQTVIWTPTNTNPLSSTTQSESWTPNSAPTDLYGAAITYTSTTTGICTVNSTTGVITIVSNVANPSTCTIVATAAAGTLYASGTATVNFDVTRTALGTQTIAWAPTTAITMSSALNFTPTVAASLTSPSTGGGAITYAVTGAGSTGCTVNATTGVVTYVTPGTCTVTATAAVVAGSYSAASVTVAFVLTLGTPTITWTPTLSLTTASTSESFTTTLAATSPQGGAITYSLTQGTNTAGCTVTGTTLNYTGSGTCSVTATAAAVSGYTSVSTSSTFTISTIPQTVTWTQTPQTYTTTSSPTTLPASAVTTGNGAITYAITETGTAVCTFNATTLVLTYSGQGTCTITPSAAATSIYSSATGSPVVFTINKPAQTVTWAPTTTIPGSTSLKFTPSTSATSNGNGSIVYTVLSSGNTAGCTYNSNGTVSYTAAGTCTIEAVAQSTSTWAASPPVDVTFTVTPVAQVITWSPPTTLNTTDSPTNVTPLATSLGGAPITYTVTSYSTTDCTLTYSGNPAKLMLTYDGTGSCTVTATTPATGIYGPGTTSVTFNVAGVPTVYTLAATGVTAVGAVLNGQVGSSGADSATGFCYSTSADLNNCVSAGTVLNSVATPATVFGSDGNVENIISDLNGALAVNTTYYFEAYATNSYGTSYGPTLSFTTASKPSVSTSPATNLQGSAGVVGATLNGNVNPDGADTTVSFCYSTSNTLTNCVGGTVTMTTQQTDGAVNTGSNPFAQVVSGLAANTTYYYEIVGVNSAGTSYGSTMSFTTEGAPTVVTSAPTSYNSTTATLAGTVSANGSAVTSISFCWGTSSVLTSCTTVAGTPATLLATDTTVESILANIAGSFTGTIYYRLSATNAVGTTNGQILSFNAGAANVTISAVTNVTRIGSTSTQSATFNGTVNPEGNTATGVFCYASSDVTVNGVLQGCTSTSAAFSSNAGSSSIPATVSGVSPFAANTTYYVQLVVTSTVGSTPVLVYSGIVSFTTPGPSTNATLPATNVTGSTATINGLLNPDGDTASVGFCWGTDPTLTTCTAVVENAVGGSSTVYETSDLTGLASGTTYYYRIFDTNGYDGAGNYGAILSFSTPAAPVATTSTAAVTPSGATLNGTVNVANDSDTEVFFCYSTSSTLSDCTSTGNAVSTLDVASVPSGDTAQPVNVVATTADGIVPGVTYYYEIEAVNSNGISYGVVESFEIPALTQVIGTAQTYDSYDSVLTTNETSLSDQLGVTGATGSVTYTEDSGSNSSQVLVSSTGQVTIVPTGLVPGTYTVTGEDVDTSGDAGTWTFILTVNGVTISQINPFQDTVTATNSPTYTDQLATSGSDGHGVTFVETPSANSTNVIVNSSGAVSVTSGGLSAGTYVVSGTDSDGSGDTGTWSFTLYVSNGVLTSTTSNVVQQSASSAFTTTVQVVGSDGGALTFVETSGTPVQVSSSGVVTVVGGQLALGQYIVTGTVTDLSGDQGTFTYTLNVVDGVLTSTNASGTTPDVTSATFVDNLAVTGSDGGAVDFVETTSANSNNVLVDAAGDVSVTAAGLNAGTYVVSGTDSDVSGDVGTWTYTLYVSDATITQVYPVTGAPVDPVLGQQGTTPKSLESTWTDTLGASGSDGNGITWAINSGGNNADFSVNTTTGVISLQVTGLNAGTYTATGTMTDNSGDAGTWTYTLTVFALSTTPVSGTVAVAGSAAYSQQLATTGNTGTVVYTQGLNGQSLGVLVSSSGLVTTTGTLQVGTYTVSGTTQDGNGTGTNTGSFTFVLTVTASTLTTTTSADSTTVGNTGAYSKQLVTTGNSGGTVVYSQSTGGSYLTVSSAGVVTTTGTLAVGPYTVTGTTTDNYGDSGTFSFTLTVNAGSLVTTPSSDTTSPSSSSGYTTTLTTTGNYGGAVVYTQTGSAASLVVSSSGVVTTTGALSANTYVATGTTLDPDGDTGSFTFMLTVVPSTFTVTFNNNTGTGTMSNETANSGVATALTTNTFTKTGYTFAGWATTSNGSVVYADGASYPFTASTTLYAIWTINSYTVTFNNNTGTGTMANETENYNVATALTTNTFTKTGYTFAGWATTSNGSVVYADGASYPFTASTTLYAQWSANADVVVFNNNTGTGSMANESYTSGTAQALTTNTFTKTGYTFTGWNTASDGTGTAYTDGQSITLLAGVTLYAQWSANADVVVFNNNGGSGSMSNESYTSGTAQALTTNTFTKTGYTFTGWNTASDGTGTAYTDGQSITLLSGITLYAQWSINSYTVTFNNNTGTGTMANETENYNVATALTTNTFTKTGYTFAGWATTSNGSVVYADGASYPFTASTTLYAIWTINSYTVTFNNNTGTGTMANETENYNVATALTTNTFTKTGYTFAGWATTSNGSVVYADGASYPFTASTTLYAQWSANADVVVFNNNTGTGSMANESYTSGTAQALTTNTFTKTGYTFTGWNTASDGTGTAYTDGQSITLLAGVTLYAQWSANADVVVFNNNGGSGSMSNESYTSGTAQALTTNTFTKTGYTFTGWNTASDGTGTAYTDGQSITLLSGITLYAQWSINSYTVTFNNNTGTGTMANETENYNVATALTTNTFTKTGYTFSGWNTAADGSGTAYADGASYSFTASTTLYAIWTINSYTVTFNNNTGTGTMANETENYNVATALTTNTFTKTGYTFAGWATTSNGSVVYADGASYPFTASTTLYAQWSANADVVVFNNNTGTGSMANESYTSGTAQALTTNTFTKTGYTFTGWNTASDGTGTAYTDGQSITLLASTTLYAQWSANADVVVFNNNGGSGSMSNESYTSGTAQALTTNTFTKTGYTFTGWNTASDGTGTAYTDGQSITLLSGITLYAQWSINSYTVTFNNNTGTGTMANETENYNVATALTTNTFTKTGYTFAGWATTSNGSVVYADGASYPFTASTTLYAIWTINSYTVTFNNNTGTGTMANETENYNVATALTTNTFTKTGYTFAGWATTSNGSVVYADGASYPFTASTTLYAIWTINSYTVTFNNNTGTGTMANETENYNVATALTTNTFTKTGYTFAGWATTSNGSVVYADGASYPFTASTTLYAIWTINSYTVTFNNNTGTGTMANETENYNVATALTTNTFTKTGYTFAGWATTSNGSVVYADGASYPFTASTTLYAIWTINSYTVTFNNNTGTGTMANETENYNVATALTTNTFTKTGYTFAGWATTSNGSVVYADGASYPFTASTTLYAQWSANADVVVFNNNGGSGSMSNESYTSGTAQALTTNTFTKTGYTFAGWATSSNGSVVYTDGQSISLLAGLTLYAVWTPNTDVVVFNNNGGSGSMSNESFTSGTAQALTTSTFTDTGYTFAGWATSSNGSVVYTDGQSISLLAGLTLYAVWTPNTDVVVFNNNGGSGSMSNESFTSGTAQALTTSTFTDTGYTFAGWATSSNGSVVYTDGQSISLLAGLTLYAVWTPNATDIISYSANSGAGVPPSSQSGLDGTTITLSGNSGLTLAGYTFGGWSSTSGGTTPLTSPYTLTGSATLYAIWTPNATDTVNYNANGGTGSVASQSGLDGTTITLAGGSTLSRAGYTFAGWSTTSVGTSPLASPFLLSGTPTTLYAIWLLNTAAIDVLTYNTNGGTGSVNGYTGPSATITLDSGSSLTRTGYTFAGWATTSTGPVAYAGSASFSLASNATLYAVWTADSTDTVTYNANGGTGTTPSPQTGLDGTTITLASGSGLTLAGYTFAGWSVSGTTPALSSTYLLASEGGTTALLAVWVPNATDTLTYNINGGSGTTPTSQSGLNGTTVTLADGSGLTLAGYNFAGWSTTSNGTTPLPTSYVLSGNATLYAIWVTNATDTVTYNDYGGTGSVASQSGLGGTTITLASGSGVALTGYTFGGWSSSPGGTTPLTSPYTLTGTVTLYAIWNANASVTVSYNVNGGTGTTPSSQTGNSGTSITLASGSGLSKSGYQFGGWSTSGSAPSLNNTYTLSGSITLYAVWVPNGTDTVIYDVDGGSGTAPSSQSGLDGTTITLASGSGLSLAGYTFLGWSVSGSTPALSSTYLLDAATTTLTAVWVPNASNSVIYNILGGSGTTPTTQSGLDGTTITLSNGSGLTLAGYTFAGWTTNSNGTGPAISSSFVIPTSDTTLYAVWTANATATVTYNDNSGTGAVSPASGLVGTTITLDGGSTVTKSGYTFGGWATTSGGSTALTSPYTLTGNATLYAIWNPITYTVVFVPEGGTVSPTTETFVSGDPSLTLLTPTRAGYVFDGWFTAQYGGSFVGLAGDPYTPNGLVPNIALYATWTPLNYTVTFAPEGGTASESTAPYTVGNPGLILPTATRTGYIFAGWFTDPDDSSTYVGMGGSSYTPTGSITLYAQWVATTTTETLSFSSNGGTGSVSSMSGAYGSSVTLPGGSALTAPAGYSTFLGWSKTSGTSASVNYNAGQLYTLTSTITLYAVWAPLATGGAPVFTSSYLPSFAYGTTHVEPITTTGSEPITLTSTTPPTGTTFVDDGGGTGTLTVGPTTAPGTYTLIFTATNAYGSTTQVYTFVIGSPNAPLPAYAITDFGNANAVFVGWGAPALGTVISYTVTPTNETTGVVGTPITGILPGNTVSQYPGLIGIDIGAGSGNSWNGYTLIGGDTYDFVVTAVFNSGGVESSATTNYTLPTAFAPSHADGTTSYSQNGSSTATMGTAGSSSYITATGYGQGSISVGIYSGNPAAGVFTVPSSTTAYDVSISEGAVFSTVSFELCGVDSNGDIDWYDSLNSTTYAVSPAAVPVSGSPTCYLVNLNSTSVPSVSDSTLYGSIFFVPHPTSGGGGGSGPSILDDPVTFTTPIPASPIVGGTYDVVATAPGGPVTYTVTGACTISGDVVTFTGTGPCVITGDVAATSTYLFGTNDQTIDVGTSEPLDPPTNASALAGDSQAEVNWTLSANAGDFIGVTYTVVASNGATCTTSYDSCLVTGLTNGVTYTFTITASATLPVATSTSAYAGSATPTPSSIISGSGGSVEVATGGGSVTSSTGDKIPFNIVTTPSSTTESIGSTWISVRVPTTGGPSTSKQQLTALLGAPSTFTGSGFVAGSVIDVYIFSTGILIGKATVNAAGGYTVHIQMPKNVAVGHHTLEIQGFVTSDARYSFRVGITLTSLGEPHSIVVPGFAINSPILTAPMKAQIAGFAKAISKSNVTSVEVVGFTDSTGGSTPNVTLSLNRARAAEAYLKALLRAYHDSKVRITIAAKGETDADATNATISGRATNRRVALDITKINRKTVT